jgi:hypothetical protein
VGKKLTKSKIINYKAAIWLFKTFLGTLKGVNDESMEVFVSYYMCN